MTRLGAVGAIALVMSAGSCGTATLDPVVAPTDEVGLVAHWKFDEGAGQLLRDSSENRHDGMITGGMWTSGRFGGGLSLKRGEHIAILDFPQATPSWSVSLWVRFAAGDLATSRAPLISAEMNGGGWEVNAPDNSHPPLLEFSLAAGIVNGRAQHVHVTCCSPPVDTWVHLTATVDGVTRDMAIYDGETRRASMAIDMLIRPGSTTLTMGNPGTMNGAPFQGTLDEIRVYSRALTEAEISAFDRSP